MFGSLKDQIIEPIIVQVDFAVIATDHFYTKHLPTQRHEIFLHIARSYRNELFLNFLLLVQFPANMSELELQSSSWKRDFSQINEIFFYASSNLYFKQFPN